MSDDDHRHLDYFDYELPPDRIAQAPIEPRDSARLLVARPATTGASEIEHHRVADLVQLLEPGDVLVLNDTRVLPARLHLVKPTGGRVEVLLLEPATTPAAGPSVGERWEALVKGGRRIKPGTELLLGGQEPAVVVGDDLGDGRRLVEIVASDLLERAGEVPLPPYIHGQLDDAERYQTVFARNPGSVAAPTAGLHLTHELLAELEASGVEVVRVELRVGIGTFRPISVDHVGEHQMHGESYVVSPDVWERITNASRVVAVGTTVVRTLESVAASGQLEGRTELFINRGYDWQVVDTLLTNFHVPRSSLLVLVDAFVGPVWKTIYGEALAEDYRFLSFGDAMLVDRRHPG